MQAGHNCLVLRRCGNKCGKASSLSCEGCLTRMAERPCCSICHARRGLCRATTGGSPQGSLSGRSRWWVAADLVIAARRRTSHLQPGVCRCIPASEPLRRPTYACNCDRDRVEHSPNTRNDHSGSDMSEARLPTRLHIQAVPRTQWASGAVGTQPSQVGRSDADPLG